MASIRERLGDRSTLIRLGLVAFVVLWLFGPLAVRDWVPVWLPFLIAVGLEVQFFLGGRGDPGPRRRRGRAPQEIDQERFGYVGEELVLVHRDGEEHWLPYSGESAEELDELLASEEPPELEPRETDWVPTRAGPVRRFVVGLAVIAALAGGAWLIESNRGWSGLEDDERAAATERYSTEAAVIAGHQVDVRCDESGAQVGAVQHADGVAEVGGRNAYLTPEICFDLYRLAFRDDEPTAATGRAVAVLAHEAWHLHGVSDEATTECYALQSGVDLGERLGMARSTARRLMQQQLVENRRRTVSTQEYRLTADCRNGGRLDLHPERSEFP